MTEWNDVHAMMLATRARAVRRRILELGASRPAIGPAELERYDGRILGRHNREVRRMLDLAERLERGSVRSERALELAGRMIDRAARMADYVGRLMADIRERRYLAELELATSRELLQLEGAPFAWPAAARARIDRSWRDLAAADVALRMAGPDGHYRTAGSAVRSALGSARADIGRARRRTAELRGILRDVDAAGPGPEPEWLRDVLAELATEPAELETTLGEAGR